ncbi:hypothetical protein VCB98_08645 [Gammaproteobacteria bacterium AB-CW1]|uniref:Copper resistance protein B n=1 Tax=Natronospira elongata TaxID=3110268 RepID=A0AAP6JF69_9GAMM|nr:hypothetical protein [Gammaproteobacteria bacterium AB-CW1]
MRKHSVFLVIAMGLLPWSPTPVSAEGLGGAQDFAARDWQGDRQRPNERQPSPRRGGLDFDYSHISVWAGTEELDESGLEGDSWRVEGAYETGESSYVFLNWQEGDYEELGSRVSRELGLGLHEHYADRSSFFVTLSYLQDRWSDDELSRSDWNLLRGRYGVRARPTDRLELDAAVVYSRATGSTDLDSRWSFDLGLSVYLGDNIALRAAGIDLDGLQPSTQLGLRVEFAGF